MNYKLLYEKATELIKMYQLFKKWVLKYDKDIEKSQRGKDFLSALLTRESELQSLEESASLPSLTKDVIMNFLRENNWLNLNDESNASKVVDIYLKHYGGESLTNERVTKEQIFDILERRDKLFYADNDLSSNKEMATIIASALCSEPEKQDNVWREKRESDEIHVTQVVKTVEPEKGVQTSSFGQAWECPRCHKIHAFYVSHCDCPPKVYTSTTYSGTGESVEPDKTAEENNNWYVDVMNLFRQFKLGNSLFRFYHRVSRQEREYWKESAIDYKRIMLGDIRQQLSDFILKHQESATKETELEGGELEIRTDLLVLKIDEFKTIVEAAIQLIPDQKIKDIKSGKSILFR